MFDVARLVEMPEALGEAVIGRLPRNSFMFVEFEEGRCVFKVAALALRALSLDVAERAEAFWELAGEAGCGRRRERASRLRGAECG